MHDQPKPLCLAPAALQLLPHTRLTLTFDAIPDNNTQITSTASPKCIKYQTRRAAMSSDKNVSLKNRARKLETGIQNMADQVNTIP